MSNIDVTADNNSFHVKWDPVTSQCAKYVSYTVQYKLIKRDQCSEVMNNPFQTLSSVDASICITNLEYYSTYTIQVTAGLNGAVITSTMASENGTTQENGKFVYLIFILYRLDLPLIATDGF